MTYRMKKIKIKTLAELFDEKGIAGIKAENKK